MLVLIWSCTSFSFYLYNYEIKNLDGNIFENDYVNAGAQFAGAQSPRQHLQADTGRATGSEGVGQGPRDLRGEAGRCASAYLREAEAEEVDREVGRHARRQRGYAMAASIALSAQHAPLVERMDRLSASDHLPHG